MLKKLIFTIIFLLALLAAEENEYRALWVTRYEITNSQNIKNLVKQASENNFNAIFVQVCGRGLAFYNSDILPKDDRVSDWDPLQLTIDEAKKHDIEVHAWINALYVWSNPKELPKSKQHVLHAHPEWLQHNKQSRNLLELSKAEKQKLVGSGYYLDPTIPKVRKHVRSIYLEVANKYNIDGLHLDYIRFPSDQLGYSPYARKDFEKRYGVDPAALTMNKALSLKIFGKGEYEKHLQAWDNYRSNSVNKIVKELYIELLNIDPEIKLSAAVIANYEEANSRYFQSWISWLEEGYIDILVPMAYDTNYNKVKEYIVFATQQGNKNERMVLAGLGAWRKSSKEISDQIELTRRIRKTMGFKELAGVVLFSYDKIGYEDDYLTDLKEKVFKIKAAVPELLNNKSRVVRKQPFDPEIDLNYHTSIVG